MKSEAPLSATTEDLWASAGECLRNARKSLGQTEYLDLEGDGAGTAYALGILAQEEIAKGFILYLVGYNAMPWSWPVYMSLRDHKCKQSWFVVLNALIANHDAPRQAGSSSGTVEAEKQLRNAIADVLNWYRYAKIQAWEQGHCDWDEEPRDEFARKIVGGKLDKRKQSGFYVSVGKDGKIVSTPESISPAEAKAAIETARKFHEFVSELPALRDTYLSKQVQWLKELLGALFAPEVRTGKEIHDAIPGVVIYEVSRTVISKDA